MTLEAGIGQHERLVRAQGRSALANLFLSPPVQKSQAANADETELGYVETGNDTISFLVRCVRNGRHAMLVGPRGTGKSYMGAKAVLKADTGGKLGVVQRIEIQGDPNKPPSDYFDDSISFNEADGRLVPSMINAPFFRLAQRKKGTNEFECHPGPENRIILRKVLKNGRLAEVDRVVIYWDEGNRSSPAMLNAVLGLLAEGRLRRDGVSYTFPPVSCILTRNPDGYDANSAKMPSPLIDRFGVQFYVYNPSMRTFVAVIAPEFLRRQRATLLRESAVAASRMSSKIVKTWVGTHLMPTLEQVERPEVPMTDDDLIAALERANDAFIEDVEPTLRAVGTDDVGLASFIQDSWARVLRVPVDNSHYRRVAARLATVVLATWGNLQNVDVKPGMQYLPRSMKDLLKKLAKMDPSVEVHLVEVGDLTRYGTSIRAFEEMLKAFLAPLLDNPSFEPEVLVDVGMRALRAELGPLLGHRCETTFNPDREPSKALRKSRSLLWLAKWILDDSRADDIVKLTELESELNAKSRVPRYQAAATDTTKQKKPS